MGTFEAYRGGQIVTAIGKCQFRIVEISIRVRDRIKFLLLGLTKQLIGKTGVRESLIFFKQRAHCRIRW